MSDGDYSHRSLPDKLGIKEGQAILVINPPSSYPVTSSDDRFGPKDFIHFFTTREVELREQFPVLKSLLAPTGMLWISWPKKSSNKSTDLDEHIIREIGLKNGLVDVKVAAIDETWTGFKFVYRIKDRP